MSHEPLFELNPVTPDSSPRRLRPSCPNLLGNPAISNSRLDITAEVNDDVANKSDDRPNRLANPAVSDAHHEITPIDKKDGKDKDPSPTSTNASYFADWCSCLHRFTFVTCFWIVVYISLMTVALIKQFDRIYKVEFYALAVSGAAWILLTLLFERGTLAKSFLCEREPLPLPPIPIGVQTPEDEPRAEPPNDGAYDAVGVARRQDPNLLMVPSRSSSRHSSMADPNSPSCSRSSSCNSIPNQDPNYLRVPSVSSSRHSVYEMGDMMESSKSSSRHSTDEEAKKE